MKSAFFILTISIMFMSLSGCASLFNGPDGAPYGDDDYSDFTQTSQAAPEANVNPSNEDYRRLYVSHAIQAGDIVPGMTPQDVIAAWGRPREVDVAGDGSYGNERWTYFTDNSRMYDISKKRIIYFENGKVAGWETRQ